MIFGDVLHKFVRQANSPSGAKAQLLFGRIYGTTEVVPFQNPDFTRASS
jgi:hypothetical protein